MEKDYQLKPEIQEHYLHLLELLENPSLERTNIEKQEILELQLKGIKELEKIYSPEEMKENKINLFSKELSIPLTTLGIKAEMNEQFINDLNINAEDKQNIKISLLNKLKNDFEESLNNTLYNKPNEEEINSKNTQDDLEHKDFSYQKELEHELVQIDTKLLAQTIIEEAKITNNTKEVVLEGAYKQAGQTQTSLVADLSNDKIKEIATNIYETYNTQDNQILKKTILKPTPNNNKKKKNVKEDYEEHFKYLFDLKKELNIEQKKNIMIEQSLATIQKNQNLTAIEHSNIVVHKTILSPELVSEYTKKRKFQLPIDIKEMNGNIQQVLNEYRHGVYYDVKNPEVGVGTYGEVRTNLRLK